MAASLKDAAGTRVWLTLGTVPDFLRRRIETRGDRCIEAVAGDGFKRTGPAAYQIHPGSTEDLITLLADLAEAPDQILVGWTLEPFAFDATAAAIDHGRSRTMETIRALALAWPDGPACKPLKVHFLTREFHEVLGGEPAQPQWSFLGASCLVATQEYPWLRCRQLDVDGLDEHSSDRIIAECLEPDEEAFVAWRRGRRWVRDFPQVRLSACAPPAGAPLRDGGVYLITGGLGRVGLLFAGHLVRRAKAKVILLGRRPVPRCEDWEKLAADPATEPALADLLNRLLDLERSGGSVMVLQADVGAGNGIAAALRSARTRFGGIHGIIHAAGIVSSRPIAESTPEDIQSLLHAKTEGIVEIYRETQNLKLDFCLLTSSLSAVLGGLGYHAYAAGNAFLDEFARWANARSDFPWISVNWDAWKFPDDANAGLGGAMYRLAMTPEESLNALDRVLAHPEISRNGLIVSTAPLAPRLEQWVHGPARRGGDRAESATGPDRSGSAIDRMLEIWKNSLRREVSPDDDYFDLGGDSLMAVGLFTEIENRFGRALPLSSLFNSPTPAKLVMLLGSEDAPSAPAQTAQAPLAVPDHVIAIRSTGTRRPLFCIHGADGGVMFYRDFALQLDEDRPFYAIEAPMIQDPGLHALDSLNAIASAYLKDIRRIQPEGPYLLGGYSFGGLVAYEIARQLKAEGIDTSQLLMFDSPNPASQVRKFSLAERIAAQWKLLGDAGFASKLVGLGRRAVSGLIFRFQLERENKLAATTEAGKGDYLRHIQSRQQHDALYETYRPQPYDGPACLFIAEAGGGDKFAYEENLGWNGYLTGELRVARVPGSHLEIFREPNLSHLLRSARELLADEG